MKESRAWTPQVNLQISQEDRVLRELREQRGMKKWSQISLTMEVEFEMGGKSGKRCRERYFNYASSLVKRDSWSAEEEKTLFRLHNQKGNKWMQIAKQLERPDNAVKNHYHSKLRKALRKVNKLIYDYLRNDFKSIKNSILPKILQTAEDYYLQTDRSQESIAKKCYQMKNAILGYLDFEEVKSGQIDIPKLRDMVKEANYFNKTFKKRKNKRDLPKRVRCNEYKGKQILKLIIQNKISVHQKIEEKDDQSQYISSSSSQILSDSVSAKQNPIQQRIETVNKMKHTDSVSGLSSNLKSPYGLANMPTFAFPYPFQFSMPMMFFNPFAPYQGINHQSLMNNGSIHNPQYLFQSKEN